MKTKAWKILQWALSGFLVLSFFVYLPHPCAFLMLATGILLLPVGPIQRFWGEILHFRPWMKGTILTLMFLLAVVNAPVTSSEPVSAPGQTPDSSAVAAASNLQQLVNSMHEVTPMPTTEAKAPADPTPAPTKAATPVPTDEPTPEATPTPTEKTAPNPDPQPVQQTVTVYVTNTGEKYHLSGCSSLRKSKIPIELSDALTQGYEPCKRCHPPTG